MPRIAYFFGIMVYMYYKDHNKPHFHASYQDLEATYSLNGDLLEGSLGRRGDALVKEWASEHVPELEENWRRGQGNLPFTLIEPLR